MIRSSISFVVMCTENHLQRQKTERINCSNEQNNSGKMTCNLAVFFGMYSEIIITDVRLCSEKEARDLCKSRQANVTSTIVG